MKNYIPLAALILFCLLSPPRMEAMGRDDSESEGLLFAASYMTLNNPFFVALHQSIEKAMEEQGDRVIVLNPDYDQILQISQIEDLLSMGVDGIFLNPVDWEGIRPALEEADKAGVPVFVVDAPVYDDQFVVSTIVSNNREAGKLAARDLLERLDGGNVVILDHPTNKPSIDRVNGFADILAGNPDFRIVSQLSAFGTLEGGMPQMENALQAHSDIDVVFGSNDPRAWEPSPHWLPPSGFPKRWYTVSTVRRRGRIWCVPESLPVLRPSLPSSWAEWPLRPCMTISRVKKSRRSDLSRLH